MVATITIGKNPETGVDAGRHLERMGILTAPPCGWAPLIYFITGRAGKLLGVVLFLYKVCHLLCCSL